MTFLSRRLTDYRRHHSHSSPPFHVIQFQYSCKFSRKNITTFIRVSPPPPLDGVSPRAAPSLQWWCYVIKAAATDGWLEFTGLENDGLESDGVEQDIGLLHPMKNFYVYDM